MQESVHFGTAVIVGSDGSILKSFGETAVPIYPRSTLKLLQAVTVLECGADLDGPELVLAAASHTGTAKHVAVVTAILDRAGLDESALQCPADWPSDPDFRRASSAPRRLTMNCSGKHAAFLLACARNGWDAATYLSPEHPLQRRILTTVEELTGGVVVHSGRDGCGAPVHAVTLEGLGRAVGSIARGDSPAGARLSAAIRRDAWALDSPALAQVMNALGLIAKQGAEGVLVVAAPDGMTVALKIVDGSSRALIPVALSLLLSQGALDRAAASRVLVETTEPVLAAGERVGELTSLV